MVQSVVNSDSERRQHFRKTTRYGGLVVVRSLCRSADAPIAVRRGQWLFCCSVTCKVKKYVPCRIYYSGQGLGYYRFSAMAKCHRQHVLKSTPVPPSLQLPWRVHDIQPLSSARCRCLLVDVLSGHACAIKLWHVRKGANNALISLISLSF